MRRYLPYLTTMGAAGLTVLGALVLSSSNAAADVGAGPGKKLYQVEITNLTRSQIISPPILASHDASVAMFELAMPASPELAELAENGNNAPLAALLGGSAGVHAVTTAPGGIEPGHTMTLTIEVGNHATRLSGAGMLVSTNDAFFALDAVDVDKIKRATLLLPAYDAGSEFNSEDCAFIPGPPCGAGAVHDPSPAEGFVYVSNGIHGIGGVPAAWYDWRDAVVRVVITRL